jgi:hypothetical protein
MKKETKKKQSVAIFDFGPAVPFHEAPDRFRKIHDELACSDSALDDYGDHIVGDPLHRGFVHVDEIIDPRAEEAMLSGEVEEIEELGLQFLDLEVATKMIFLRGQIEFVPADYVEEKRVSLTCIRRRLAPFAAC